MPLIQAALAKMYMRPAKEIEVGFQEMDGSHLETVVFGGAEIEAAQRRFRALGEKLQEISRAQP
jgi:hypothetical protein